MRIHAGRAEGSHLAVETKVCTDCRGTGLEPTSGQNGDGGQRLCQTCKGVGRVPA